MAENKFDPEAVREFQRSVREKLLDPIEDELMPMFENGNILNREPRWGQLTSAQSAKTTYATFHSTTWNAMETLRKDLYGLLERLDESVDSYGDAEDANTAEQNSYGDQL